MPRPRAVSGSGRRRTAGAAGRRRSRHRGPLPAPDSRQPMAPGAVPVAAEPGRRPAAVRLRHRRRWPARVGVHRRLRHPRPRRGERRAPCHGGRAAGQPLPRARRLSAPPAVRRCRLSRSHRRGPAAGVLRQGPLLEPVAVRPPPPVALASGAEHRPLSAAGTAQGRRAGLPVRQPHPAVTRRRHGLVARPAGSLRRHRAVCPARRAALLRRRR